MAATKFYDMCTGLGGQALRAIECAQGPVGSHNTVWNVHGAWWPATSRYRMCTGPKRQPPCSMKSTYIGKHGRTPECARHQGRTLRQPRYMCQATISITYAGEQTSLAARERACARRAQTPLNKVFISLIVPRSPPPRQVQ